MNKQRYIVVILCVAALTASIFVFGKSKQSALAAPVQEQASSPQQSRPVPDYIVYGMLLNQAVLSDKKADELEKQGKPDFASSLRTYFQRNAELNDEQAQTLRRIASDIMREAKQLDAQAKVIIDARRAHYPGGVLRKGQQPLPPSPELAALQAKRNALMLRGRDRLREALGETEWERFRDFVERRFASTITVQSAPSEQRGDNQ